MYDSAENWKNSNDLGDDSTSSPSSSTVRIGPLPPGVASLIVEAGCTFQRPDSPVPPAAPVTSEPSDTARDAPATPEQTAVEMMPPEAPEPPQPKRPAPVIPDLDDALIRNLVEETASAIERNRSAPAAPAAIVDREPEAPAKVPDARFADLMDDLLPDPEPEPDMPAPEEADCADGEPEASSEADDGTPVEAPRPTPKTAFAPVEEELREIEEEILETSPHAPPAGFVQRTAPDAPRVWDTPEDHRMSRKSRIAWKLAVFGPLIALPAAFFALSPFAPKDTVGHYAALMGCQFAESFGIDNAKEGSPGYHASLDTDGDGVACEPVRSTRITMGGGGSRFIRP